MTGYVLQLVGMIFAISGLLSIREHFGLPLLKDISVDWLKRFPLRKQSITIQAKTSFLTLTGMKASVNLWTPDKPDNSIEDRIADIITNLDRLRDGQSNNTQAIDKLEHDHEKHKKSHH
jgi:hypothetical protein